METNKNEAGKTRQSGSEQGHELYVIARYSTRHTRLLLQRMTWSEENCANETEFHGKKQCKAPQDEQDESYRHMLLDCCRPITYPERVYVHGLERPPVI